MFISSVSLTILLNCSIFLVFCLNKWSILSLNTLTPLNMDPQVMPTRLLSTSPGFSVSVMFHSGRFATTSFSATQRCAMLEQCCNHSKQYRNNIMLQRCVALKRELKQQRRRRQRKRHLKGEVDAWNFIVLIPSRSIRKMLATISVVKCLNSVSKVRKGKRKPLSCVHVLHKTWN